MFKMKRGKKGSYVRDGMAVEVVAQSSDTYDQMVQHGRTAINLKDKSGMKLCIFTMAGAMIPSGCEWTLGEYLKRIKKSDAKIGIGYVEVGILLCLGS